MGCGWVRDPSFHMDILVEVIDPLCKFSEWVEFQANHRHSFHDQLLPSRPSANRKSTLTGITLGEYRLTVEVPQVPV